MRMNRGNCCSACVRQSPFLESFGFQSVNGCSSVRCTRYYLKFPIHLLVIRAVHIGNVVISTSNTGKCIVPLYIDLVATKEGYYSNQFR
jgi:hypothetical protein